MRYEDQQLDIRHGDANEGNASASDEGWADMIAARQKLLELEEINHRLKEDLTKRLMICGGCAATAVCASYALSHFKDNPPSIAIVLVCQGLFVACTAISQLVTAVWGIRKSNRLRDRLLEAVSEALEEPAHGLTLMKRG